MNISTESFSSFADLERSADTSATPANVFLGCNLGNRTILLKLSLFDFFRNSMVANERGATDTPFAQRRLDLGHATKLALYVLRGLVAEAIAEEERLSGSPPESWISIQNDLGRQPYLSLQPIVANLRNHAFGGDTLRKRPMMVDQETVAIKVWLGQRDILWIVDGQHRRKGIELVFDFLDEVSQQRRYKKKGLFAREEPEIPMEELRLWERCYDIARSSASIMVELHLGLNVDQERQLFHDLNQLGKKIEASLALEFDSANPVNQFIKDELIAKGIVEVTEGEKIDWTADTGAFTRKDIVAVNAHLLLNKSNISGAKPQEIACRLPVAKRFWTAISAIEGFGEPQAKLKTVAAQPVVLKALAKLCYDFAFSPRHADEANLERLLDGVTDVDFSHSNPMWRYFELSPAERASSGLAELAEYLPMAEDGKNRDLGAFDGQSMRFGAKHNDIYPLLGDMIRWKLKLPARPQNLGAPVVGRPRID